MNNNKLIYSKEKTQLVCDFPPVKQYNGMYKITVNGDFQKGFKAKSDIDAIHYFNSYLRNLKPVLS